MSRALHSASTSLPALRRSGETSVLGPITLLLTGGSLPLPTADPCTG
jgi:hypothetical protein